MYQTEREKTYKNRENTTDSIAPKQNLWYNNAEKNTTNNCTLTIESNPCFRILHPDSSTPNRGRSDTRLQKTEIHIIQQKQDSELLRPIFNCVYEVLNKGDPVKTNRRKEHPNENTGTNSQK